MSDDQEETPAVTTIPKRIIVIRKEYVTRKKHTCGHPLVRKYTYYEDGGKLHETYCRHCKEEVR